MSRNVRAIVTLMAWIFTLTACGTGVLILVVFSALSIVHYIHNALMAWIITLATLGAGLFLFFGVCAFVEAKIKPIGFVKESIPTSTAKESKEEGVWEVLRLYFLAVFYFVAFFASIAVSVAVCGGAIFLLVKFIKWCWYS